ncbi:MAG: type II secretion system F family protein [Verrucomicrobia bacterium]|nr:type II secretion system F family protein [Verrucomicrobiota bacterium]
MNGNHVIADVMLGASWALAFGGLAWYIGRTATEITYVTLADGRRRERRLPLLFRWLLPLVPNVLRFVEGERYSRTKERAGRQLLSAGYSGLMSPQEFLAIRILLVAVMAPVMIVLLRLFFESIPGPLGDGMLRRQGLFYGAAVLYTLFYTPLWLRSAVRRRHREIEHALPFVLDLLTLSVEAGLDFMSAIQRIIERRQIDPVSEDLVGMFREVQLGKTRREALKHMARSSGQSDLQSVVNALVQADEMGVSIGAILRIQADQMRTRRFQRAEKKANEAPVRLLFPLVAFIFPSVLIVLLGPVLMQLIQHGF